MRCKPGDLCVIVNPHHPLLQHLIGVTLTVTKPAGKDWAGDDCWFYEGPRLRACGLVCGNLPDKWLRPIRDTDGADEMLRDLPYQVAHA